MAFYTICLTSRKDRPLKVVTTHYMRHMVKTAQKYNEPLGFCSHDEEGVNWQLETSPPITEQDWEKFYVVQRSTEGRHMVQLKLATTFDIALIMEPADTVEDHTAKDRYKAHVKH